MSLIDEAREAREVRERVLVRLAELEPLIAEHAELATLAAEMGWTSAPDPARARDVAAPALTPARRPAPAPSAGRKTTGRKAAARRSTRKQGAAGPRAAKAGGVDPKRIVAVVKAAPGSTVAQIASELGVESQALFAPVRDLTDAGRLTKRGRQLYPAD